MLLVHSKEIITFVLLLVKVLVEISDNNNNTVKGFVVIVVVVIIMIINTVAISVVAVIHAQNKSGFLKIGKKLLLVKGKIVVVKMITIIILLHLL